MAIQPIDLQTLFSQMDTVGKNQASLREGAQIQQALQQAESQRKAEEQVRSVNEAQNMGDGAERIKDGETRRRYSGQGRGDADQAETAGEEEAPGKTASGRLIRDPALGRNIDISG